MLWLISWIRDQAFVRTLSALKMKWSLAGRMKAEKTRYFENILDKCLIEYAWGKFKNKIFYGLYFLEEKFNRQGF